MEVISIKIVSKDRNFDKSKGSYGQETKDRIFDISIELFSKKGFNAVSIRDIAREVGIKQSSLYNHFSSKEEILKDIYEYFKAEAINIFLNQDELDEVIQRCSPIEFFRKGNELFIKHMLNPRMEKIWRILLIEQASDKRAANLVLNECFRKSLDFVEKALGKMLKRGKIAQVSPRICSYEYTYPLNFMFMEYVISRTVNCDISLLEKQMNEHIEFFCDTVLKS